MRFSDRIYESGTAWSGSWPQLLFWSYSWIGRRSWFEVLPVAFYESCARSWTLSRFSAESWFESRLVSY